MSEWRDIESAPTFDLLKRIVEHHAALSGPRAHRLGCDCGGTNDGIHTCASFEATIDAARKAVASLVPNPPPR